MLMYILIIIGKTQDQIIFPILLADGRYPTQVPTMAGHLGLGVPSQLPMAAVRPQLCVDVQKHVRTNRIVPQLASACVLAEHPCRMVLTVIGPR